MTSIMETNDVTVGAMSPANNCSFRLGEAVRGGGVDAGCRNAHAWWDDAGTSRIQAILILRVHGTY